VRRLFTTTEAYARGITRDALRWGETTGRWRRIERGVYGVGPEPPSQLDIARARVIASGGAARGGLAGVLHDLDSVRLTLPGRRLADAGDNLTVVGGVACANGLLTLVDLAATLDDDTWEQVLESALRTKLTTVLDLEAAVPDLGRARVPGTSRIRRVLARRPHGAPPTESLLETLLLQMARAVPMLGDLDRQVEVFDEHGLFVARVDLAKLDLGLFFELDGQHHLGQPVYDASRETAVVAATGWLCGRFTWREVTRTPRTTVRRLTGVAAQAERRPFKR
jgi:very-short-patch-repair endonuclease